MKTLLWLFMAMALGAAAAQAQVVAISGQAISIYGQPVPNAQVRVCSVTSTGTPCTPTTPIYQDYALSIPLTNPAAADQYGNYTVYAPALAAPNLYDVQLSPASGVTWSYIFNGPLATSTIAVGGDLSGTVGNATVTKVHATTGTINGVTIGATTPSTGNFSTLAVLGVPVLPVTGASVSAAIDTPPGSQHFGDSISGGTGASPFTKGYAYLSAQAFGGPQSVSSTARSGEQALDGGTFLETGTANGVSNYIVEYGTNDVTQYNSSTNLQNVFRRSYLHDLLWPSIASTATLTGSCTQTSGTWTADGLLVTGMGVASTTNGSILTCSNVNAPKGSDTLYIGYHIFNGDGGTFAVSVDGSPQTDPISSSTTWVAYGDGGSTITTQNGGTYGVVAARLANSFTSGNHTVTFAVTSATGASNIVEPDYVVFAPATPPAYYGVAVTPNPQNNSNSGLVPTYLGFVTAIQGQLSADGFTNIVLANTNAALLAGCPGGTVPFTTCYVDTIHPNNTGHGIMAATVEAAVPAALLTGIEVPTNNQTTDILAAKFTNTPAAWWTPNGYGGQLQGTQTGWQPGIAWLKTTGLVYGTTFVPGGGATTIAPSSGVNIASWCAYTEAGYGAYGTVGSLAASCPMRANVADVGFFSNNNGVYALDVQQNNIYVHSAGSSVTTAPTGSWNHYLANSYITDQRAATSSNNYPSPNWWHEAKIYNGTVGTVSDWQWENIPAAGANPAEVFTAVHGNGGSGPLQINMLQAAQGVLLPGTSTVSGQLICEANGTNCPTPPTFGLYGTTGTITGVSLAVSCVYGSASVPGAVVGHAVAVSTTDGSDVGAAFVLRAYIASANSVAVAICNPTSTAATPPSKAYNVFTY